MTLSVVVPTLNDRKRLTRCLDTLTERASDAEVIVVNGPSADGTTGMVHDRDDVDVLVQVADRNVNVARNAGLEVANGDIVALVGSNVRIDDSWVGAIRTAIADGADAVTGPIHRTLRGGVTVDRPTVISIAGQEVIDLNCRNVAFDRGSIDALDGFDEYLTRGGARDVAHRLARQDRTVRWDPDVSAQAGPEDDREENWGETYRSFAYCLVKNYGPRPSVLRQTGGRALADGGATASGIARGERTPTRWLSEGRAVLTNAVLGSKDGIVARVRDRSERRNPTGISARDDRAVERYDWR